MASPFGIRFFTRGYEKTHREMSSVEKKAKVINTGFVKMGRTGAGVGPAMARGLGILKSGLSAATGIMKVFLGLVLRVGVALGVAGGAVAGVGVALSTKFAKGLMSVRENFYLIETALTGVVKNAAQVRKISEWAMKYAAVFPAMYSDVMDAMKGLAMMPALKPIFTKASVADMEKIMNIVQGLAALDPQQGVKGALLAIREALAGQWRTLQMRFEIRPQAVASAAGLTMDELKNMPDKAIQALDAFIRLNVGADTLRKSAESLGVQWGNLSDQYEMWLNRVAQFGAYRKLVEFLLKLNDILFDIFKSDAAKRWGQDISRVFEGAILSIQSSITGIDWTGEGVFDGIVKAAKDIIKKVKSVFVDAKDMLTSAAQLLFAYMAKGTMITIKEVFYPVGKAIIKTILEGMVAEIDKHPVIAMLAAAIGGGIAGGTVGNVPGAIVGAGAGVTGLIMAFTKLEESIKASKEAASEGEGTEGGWLGNINKKIEQFKTNVKEGAKKVWGKIEPELPERKEITAATPAEEQAKKVVEARSNLRLAELAGAKELVEVLKSQLVYEERLFEYHRKSGEWGADPKRGGREATLKKEMAGLKTELSKEIGVGKTFEQTEAKRTELSKKEIEFTRLTKEKEKTLGDVKRYTGPELAQKALDATEKEQNLKFKLLDTEKQINKLKKEGGEEVSQLQDLEKKLISLSKQKVAVERQYVNAKRQVISIQKQIRMLEVMRGGGPAGEIGVSGMERAKSLFQTFYQGFMEKRAVQRQFGQAEVPGAGGMTWGAGATKSRERETRGIPIFLLRQEEQLRRKLQTAESPEEKKMILDKLYQANVEQFQMARGRTAKGAQFFEANEIQAQLQGVSVQLQEEQIVLAKEQAENIKNTVVELRTTNKWLSSINGKVGLSNSGDKSTTVTGDRQTDPSVVSSFMNQINKVVWSPVT